MASWNFRRRVFAFLYDVDIREIGVIPVSSSIL